MLDCPGWPRLPSLLSHKVRRFVKRVGDFTIPVDFLTERRPATQGASVVHDVPANILPGTGLFACRPGFKLGELFLCFLQERHGEGDSPFQIGRAKGLAELTLLVAIQHAGSGALLARVDFIHVGEGPVVAALGGKRNVRMV